MQVIVPGSGRPYSDGDMLDLSAPLVFTIDDLYVLRSDVMYADGRYRGAGAGIV